MEPRLTRLRMRVSPGAGRSAVVGRYGEGWKVRVAAPPEKGRANAEVVALVAGSLGLGRPAVRVVAGAASRDKVIEVDGLSHEEAERLLAVAGEERS
ncbi:hypothetical protein Gocc_0987 [Gaiella occulta]|uniref:UPF0235 protein Gocc_0987 n=1 Tax=Gaiella occulta TaxID=1002870 RepID=A0A7M2YYT1_9ACTN|nr:DUF167 domain-containing protein [Gaiella occulta]RDI75189.1 hypothetical protein Gocc_0987 [Gaiella occulta]